MLFACFSIYCSTVLGCSTIWAVTTACDACDVPPLNNPDTEPDTTKRSYSSGNIESQCTVVANVSNVGPRGFSGESAADSPGVRIMPPHMTHDRRFLDVFTGEGTRREKSSARTRYNRVDDTLTANFETKDKCEYVCQYIQAW